MERAGEDDLIRKVNRGKEPAKSLSIQLLLGRGKQTETFFVGLLSLSVSSLLSRSFLILDLCFGSCHLE